MCRKTCAHVVAQSQFFNIASPLRRRRVKQVRNVRTSLVNTNKAELTSQSQAADFVELERLLFENIEPASVEEAEDILEALASVFSSEVSEARLAAGLLSPKVDEPPLVAGELPDTGARYHILVEQIPAVVFMAFLNKSSP
ncbi:MAG TPA: hypothetical protein VGC87_02910 [Pyrinomonadaceae bacterium]